MMWLKACPRCESRAMYLDEDNERHCMQCGHVQHSPTDPRAARELARLLTIGDSTISDISPYLQEQLQTAAN